jgi:hypothetical protein
VRSTALDSPPRRRPIGRALLPLGLVFLSVGLSSAVVVPFLSLFLSTAVRTGPVKVTVFLVAAPLAGVIVATWTLWLTAGGFTLLQCPLTLGVQALPLAEQFDHRSSRSRGGSPARLRLFQVRCPTSDGGHSGRPIFRKP